MASITPVHSVITTDINNSIFIQNSYLIFSILCSYILFIKVVGPSIMKNRKAMDLKLLMIVYNGILVACNVYLSAKVTALAWELWPVRCDIQSLVSKEEQKFHKVSLVAFFVKFFELFDTVIFVLRKKFHQASFLHIYHHTIVCALYWVCLRYKLVGYYIILTGSINCSIHVLLYLYYALSAFGPEVRRYLWWKSHLTKLQIIQFVVILVYMFYGFATGCEKFNYFEVTCLFGLLFILLLFMNFYNRTYKPKKRA